MPKLDLTIAENALNVLNKRHNLMNVNSYKRVPVTHVSFADGSDVPHTSDDWNDGEPYAIVNLNAFNPYYKTLAEEHFMNEEYEEACQKTMSFRASIEDGVLLKAAMFANVVTAERTFTPEGTEDEITTIAVYKATPSEMVAATVGGFMARVEVENETPVNTNEPPA